MTAFLGICALIFICLTIIWTKKDWFNASIKIIFFSMSIWSSILFAATMGWLKVVY